jgi:hypothetical protein
LLRLLRATYATAFLDTTPASCWRMLFGFVSGHDFTAGGKAKPNAAKARFTPQQEAKSFPGRKSTRIVDRVTPKYSSIPFWKEQCLNPIPCTRRGPARPGLYQGTTQSCRKCRKIDWALASEGCSWNTSGGSELQKATTSRSQRPGPLKGNYCLVHGPVRNLRFERMLR